MPNEIRAQFVGEGKARESGASNEGKAEMVLPWPGQEPIRVLVPPASLDTIVKIYGPKSRPGGAEVGAVA